MKVIFIILIFLSLHSCGYESKRKLIKTMTYNIHYGMDSNFSNRGKKSALNQVVEYINEYDLDIILLQEFPQGKKKYASYLEGQQKNPIKYLQENLGNIYNITEIISRDGDIYIGGKSLVIISKFPIINQFTLDLPQPLWHQTRKVLLLRLKIENRELWIANTHLYYKENIINYNDLVASLKWIVKQVSAKSSIIFGGDLNFDKTIDTIDNYEELTEDIDGESKYKLIESEGFKDPYFVHTKKSSEVLKNTFISNDKRPDYLFFKNLLCYSYFHGDSNNSDHYPVFAEFYFYELEKK